MFFKDEPEWMQKARTIPAKTKQEDRRGITVLRPGQRKSGVKQSPGSGS